MRVFVVIDLPETARSELMDMQDAFAAGRPVPEDNLHLTLCFLGDQRDEAVEEAHFALSRIRAPVFDLQIVGAGSFGQHSQQVIYADVERCPQLLELEKTVTRSLRSIGLDFQKRRFRPHVTIARLPKSLSRDAMIDLPQRLAHLSAFRGTPFPVEHFQLYQSILKPDGAQHEILADYALETRQA